MNKHRQARAEILKGAGYIPLGKSKGRTKSAIKVTDYWPTPLPANLLAQPVGDCLIWTGQLNQDGYGVGNFPDDVKLAHAQAYTQSRRARPGPRRSICHICNRPYCIQPSHLYEGDNKTNSDDRKLRVGKGSMALVFQKHDEVLKAAKYFWDSPSTNKESLLEPDAVDVEHKCEYIIPAGDVRICAICENPEDPNLRRNSGQKRLQPPNTDRNTHSIVKFDKAITDLGNGVVLCSNSEMELNFPRNRAERRRRQRVTKKQPAWDKPVLIHQSQGIVRVNDPRPIEVKMASPFVAPGDGLLVVMVSTTPLRDPSAETLKPLMRPSP